MHPSIVGPEHGVVLRSEAKPTEDLNRLYQRATAAGNDVDAALALAVEIGADVPVPGDGRTIQRWELLATLAAADLTTARVIEPHLDALAILSESGADSGASRRAQTWGVFASEGPEATVAESPSGRLSGVKPWCSLAGALTNALLTAKTGEQRALFAIDLRDPGVHVEDVAWISRGLAAVHSGPIGLQDVPAVQIGAPGWYLSRPGFWWGGIGVAACWYGGAVALARSAWSKVAARPTDIGCVQLARIDLALHTVRAVLVESALVADASGDGTVTDLDRPPAEVIASRARAICARTAEDVLREVNHVMGPAPLAFDEVYARRVADLEIYIRQHHADRDLAVLGRSLVAGDLPY